MTDTTNSFPLYEELLGLANKIADGEADASIIFMDLVGSTEFKAIFGPGNWSPEDMATELIAAKTVGDRGEVVKYIGDEIMVVVRDTNHAATACSIARDVLKRLAELNSKHSNDPKFPIHSKIGIHCGPVQYWDTPA